MGISSMCFFSSRRRHTRYIGDWSSDVCSSDLHCGPLNPREAARAKRIRQESDHAARKLGEEIHRVLTPQGHGAGRGERKNAPRLAAPPAEIVDVVDAGVDEDTAPGRPDIEPPTAWTPIAAGDQVELAELAEPAAGNESVDVTEGRHEAEVLRDHPEI